jgi:hypothetical protein
MGESSSARTSSAARSAVAAWLPRDLLQALTSSFGVNALRRTSASPTTTRSTSESIDASWMNIGTGMDTRTPRYVPTAVVRGATWLLMPERRRRSFSARTLTCSSAKCGTGTS